MDTLAVVDYGSGNLKSVSNALSYLGIPHEITGDRTAIAKAAAVLLPGVGAFPDAMKHLYHAGLVDFLKEQAAQKPFLGICLGMQLLFSLGEEVEETRGLGLIEGVVKRMDTPLKLPQIGWNSLEILRPCALTKGLPPDPYVYFVHSFCAVPEKESCLSAVTDYGARVAAVVSEGHVFGCQFHPEKSGEPGLIILKNFGELIQ